MGAWLMKFMEAIQNLKISGFVSEGLVGGEWRFVLSKEYASLVESYVVVMRREFPDDMGERDVLAKALSFLVVSHLGPLRERQIFEYVKALIYLRENTQKMDSPYRVL